MDRSYEETRAPFEISPPVVVSNKRAAANAKATGSVRTADSNASEKTANPNAHHGGFLSSHEKGIIAKYELSLNEFPPPDSPDRMFRSKFPVYQKIKQPRITVPEGHGRSVLNATVTEQRRDLEDCLITSRPNGASTPAGVPISEKL